MRVIGTFPILCVMVAGIVCSGCGKEHAPEMPPRPVKTALSSQRDVPTYIESFGNLNALKSVDIKSQVTGQIMEVHFTEGKKVAKGDLLFTIDPRTYKAELEKAQAQLAVDQFDLKLKKDLLERNRPLVKKKLIADQDYEKLNTDVDATESRVKLDEAEVQMAKIKLDYCSIVSPVDGETGKVQVDPGNIVPENNGPTLVNIKLIDTLYVDFTVTDRELARVREAMAAGILKVEVLVSGNSGKVHSGDLKLIENSVDNTTGTIFLRAVVPNTDNELWAGQFVDVRLVLGTQKGAVLVPADAVQYGQAGPYLFAVTPEGKADLRLVKTGSRQGSDIVVEKGIGHGERVVTFGQMGLSPNCPVKDVDGTAGADRRTDS
ncbi:MAG TPA: efflux RND transporter periplasmic adaptor subunit [bacterium]|nr:efflux RND transporter periplasmic adaptor subunit [bacterium]